MKRAIAILIAILYLLPSIGYSIDIKWCCNKISGISFSPVKTAKCNMCVSPKHCCKNTHIVVKLKDTQHSSTPTKISSNTAPSNVFYHVVFTSSVADIKDYINYRPPPLVASQPIYLITGDFRV